MVQDGIGDVGRGAGLVCACPSAGLVRRCVAALRRPFGYPRGRLGPTGKRIHKVFKRWIGEEDLHRAQSCVSILAYEAGCGSASQTRRS